MYGRKFAALKSGLDTREHILLSREDISAWGRLDRACFSKELMHLSGKRLRLLAEHQCRKSRAHTHSCVGFLASVISSFASSSCRSEAAPSSECSFSSAWVLEGRGGGSDAWLVIGRVVCGALMVMQ